MRNGFTLIEVMVVVAMVAILATLAVPNLSRMVQHQRLAGEGNALLGAFSEAQGLAIATGRPARLAVDRVNGVWSVQAARTGAGLTSISTHRLAGQVEFGPATGSAAAFPAPFNLVPHSSWCTTCTGNSGHVEFDADGTISGALDGGAIFLQSTPHAVGEVYAVAFVGATGAVRLLRISE